MSLATWLGQTLIVCQGKTQKIKVSPLPLDHIALTLTLGRNWLVSLLNSEINLVFVQFFITLLYGIRLEIIKTISK